MNAPAVGPARFGPRHAQPLDHFMSDAKSVLEGLFAKVDPKDLPPMAAALLENNERIRAIAAKKFDDEDGEALLEFLCDALLRRPMFITQMGLPPDQALSLGQFREGQAAAVYFLLALIAEGRSEQPPQREGNHESSTTGTRRKRRVDDGQAAVPAAYHVQPGGRSRSKQRKRRPAAK